MSKYIFVIFLTLSLVGCVKKSPLLLRNESARTPDVPIVFIHGWRGDSGVWGPAESFFRENGYKNVYRFDYRDTTNEYICNNVERLLTWLKKNHLANEPIILVGHSMGGLVARRIALDHPELQIVKIVTLATPNNGVKWWSNLLPEEASPAVDDMKPGSNFLKYLNSKSWPTYTPQNIMAYSITDDELVSEGDAKIMGAKNLWIKKGAAVYGNAGTHSSIVNKKQVLTDVLRFVREETKILPGGPELHGADCAIFTSNRSTVRWRLPADAPAHLRVYVSSEDNDEVRNIAACKEIVKDLEKKPYLLRYVDEEKGITSQPSRVSFWVSGLSCKTTVTNNPVIMEHWDVNDVIRYPDAKDMIAPLSLLLL